MNPIELLYHLKFNKIFIWKEKDSISYSFADEQESLIEGVRENLQQHKLYLLEILEYNNICSEESSKQSSYYKVPRHLHQQNLSWSQKSMYLHSKIAKTKYIYNIPVFIKFKHVNTDKIKQVIDFVLQKHSILRTILDPDFQYRIEDISLCRVDETQVASINDINQFCIEKAKQSFQLEDSRLIRLELIKIDSTGEVILNLTHHHILSDAYSVNIIISEILAGYKKLLYSKEPLHLNKAERLIDYFDYVDYQNCKLQTTAYKEAISNLAQKFNAAEALKLRNHDLTFDNTACRIKIDLDNTTFQELQKLSINHSVSLYSILLTCFYHTLSLYSGGTKDFAIGVTISNRPFEFNNAVGPFISILPLIPEYNVKHKLLDNIKAFHRDLSYLNEYQEININTLIEKLKYHPDYINQLINVIFSLHNFKQNLVIKNDELEFIDIKELGEKVGISVVAEENNDNLSFEVSYVKNIYDEHYIKSIFDTYVHLLSQINNLLLMALIQKLKCIKQTHYNTLLYDWNNTSKKYDITKKITEIFEEQVSKQPDSIAVVYQDLYLDYQELNYRANQLANYLLNHYKVKPDTLIGLLLDRSEQMLVAILAILKAGAAYVPIDLDFPAERINYILKDTSSKLVISNKIYQSKLLNITDISVLYVDDRATQQQFWLQSTSTPNVTSTSHNLAYVIYTSGTTGNPKGVMIENKNVVNYINNINILLGKTGHIVDFSTNIAFDLSVTTTLWALCSGATVIIYDQILQNLETYKKHLIKHAVNFIKLTPSYFELLVDTLSITKVNKVILGGEKVSSNLVDQIIRFNPKLIIYDEYGPTEATVGTSTGRIYQDLNNTIGKPYHNYKVYVLDKHLNNVPIGAIGELYIGGYGLARGYLNNPSLTAEKFVANPFALTESEKNNLRLYKTGDLVCFLPTGDLQFIGRNDSQIKLNGFRIELNEVTNAIKKHMDIKQATVVAKENKVSGHKTLVAYIIPGEFTPSEDELNDFLKKLLPKHMIPSYFIYLDKLPLTLNGKLDQKKLPEPITSSTQESIAPKYPFEKQVAHLWSEILGISENAIGIQDDFFKLGGNSLLAIRLINQLNQTFNAKLGIDLILRNSIFNQMCWCLKQDQENINRTGQKYEF
jgi:amino acid adenylation domain-containing protein